MRRNGPSPLNRKVQVGTTAPIQAFRPEADMRTIVATKFPGF